MSAEFKQHECFVLGEGGGEGEGGLVHLFSDEIMLEWFPL